MARKSVKEERRRQILQALDKCLLEKSFEQTSIKDISRVAQVNHGVLHYYFKSKEDILLHYIDYVVDDFKSQVQEVLNVRDRKDMAWKDFLREIFRFANNRITLDSKLSKIFVEIWEIALYHEEVRKKLKQAYMEWFRILAENLNGSDDRKEMVTRLSIAMIAFSEGISLFTTIFDNSEVAFEEVLESLQERMLDIL